MKKVFGIFMILLALAFVSCSNAAGSDGDDGAGDNSESSFPVVFSRTVDNEDTSYTEVYTFYEDGTGKNEEIAAECSSLYPLTWTGSLSASGSGTVIIKYSETKIEAPSFSISADGRTMTVDWHNEGEDLEIFTRQ